MMDCATTILTAARHVTLISGCAGSTLVTGGTSITILGPGPGPRGPVGPEGPSGSTTFAKKSSGAISGHRVVRSTDGTHIDYCDANTLTHRDICLGITTNAASAAEQDVAVVGQGEIEEGSWSWTPGLPIFCGPNGVLTQTFSPLWAWSRIVAFAESATKILVQLREPIQLI